jgi:hypothetical protein
MGAITYEIYAGPGVAPTFLLSEYNTITLTTGRQQVQDPFKAGTATITGRDISNVTGLNIGDFILIRVTEVFGTAVVYTAFSGTISDITADYGAVSNQDTWTIQAEDFIADLGRAFTTNSWPAGIATSVAAAAAISGTGVGLTYVMVPTGSSTVSGQSWTNENVLNIFNQLLATEQGRLRSSASILIRDVEWYNRSSLNFFGTLCNFTDGTVASALPAVVYQQVEFRSRADSFFTKTIVEPEGLASQSAGTGTRVFTMQSYDQTTAQAGDLAAYVLATLDVSQDVPARISYIAENQPSASNQFGLRAFLEGPAATRSILVTLRGSVFACFVEGGTLSATPAQTRFTLNLSSSEAAVGFILDDTILGVLDTSKLGF